MSKHASLLPVCHAWASFVCHESLPGAGPPTEGKGLPGIDGKLLRCQHRLPLSPCATQFWMPTVGEILVLCGLRVTATLPQLSSVQPVSATVTC